MIDQVQAKPSEQTTSDALTVHLSDLLPAKTLAGLRAEAETRHIPLTDLVREVLYYYVAEQTEDGLLNTPDEIIEAHFRESWRNAMTGEPGEDALEMIAQVRRELGVAP